jgi:4-hydroxy-tetrahydrodipicolinate synthase
MSEHRPLRGYFPIMPTPYTAEGEVDLPSLSRLVDYLIDHGAQGMSPNGGDSEAPCLSVAERKAITETVVAASDGRAPVLVGTSAVTVEESVELNRHAQQAGADAVFTHPGWGRQGLSCDEIVEYYDAICSAIDIPIMVHGTHDMDLAVITTLAAKFPGITYVKEETSHGPKLRQYMRELGDRLTFFGPGLHYPGELGWGALGVMPSCCAPRAHARIFDLWQTGDHDEARAVWNRMLPLVFWRWHTAAGEAGKLYLEHEGVFTTHFVRQRVSQPGKADGDEVSFGTLTLDEADRQEMLAILATLDGPRY